VCLNNIVTNGKFAGGPNCKKKGLVLSKKKAVWENRSSLPLQMQIRGSSAQPIEGEGIQRKSEGAGPGSSPEFGYSNKRDRKRERDKKTHHPPFLRSKKNPRAGEGTGKKGGGRS